jgi:hypothetical protein
LRFCNRNRLPGYSSSPYVDFAERTSFTVAQQSM